jgi:Tol biopolymer transport system component
MLTSRPLRAVLLLVIAAVAAAVVVVAGAGPQRRAEAAVSPGTTELVSVGDRVPIAPSGEPSISADGRYVAFASTKSFDPLDVLRHGDSDMDIYVRDRVAKKTILLSHGVLVSPEQLVGARGLPKVLTVPADGASQSPSISADGRYVAFMTTATNLGPRQTTRERHVVVVDRDPDGNGVFDERNCLLLRLYCHEFTEISPAVTDQQGRPLGDVSTPRISAAGDAVVWVGSAQAPGSRQAAPSVVYRSVLTKGPTGAVTGVRSARVSPVVDGLAVRGTFSPALSGDGNRLVMAAKVDSTDNEEEPTHTAVLGVDFSEGPLPDSGGEGYRATRLDVDGAGAPLAMPGNWDPAPTINANGRQIAFCTPGPEEHVILAVRWEGPDPLRSELVSSNTEGAPVNGAEPALSANGRYIAFTSWSRTVHNGVDGPDQNCDPDTGPVPGAAPGAPPILPILPALPPLLGGGDTPAPPPQPRIAQPPGPQPSDISHCDVVVRDLGMDRARAAAGLPRLPAELASASITRDCVPDLAPDASCEGDDASRNAVLSADGGVVAFESQASGLVPDDPNGHVQDVFARTFTPRLTGDPVDFFTVAPGSSTLGSADLRHQGFGPLLVQSLAISGPNAAEFTLTAETCVGRVLQAGEGCLASIQFTPAAVGQRHAMLEVRYVGLASPLFVPLTGAGDTQPPRAVTVIPEPLSFGDRLPLTQTPPGAVTVRNTGAAPLTINKVGLPPDAGADKHPEDYTIVQDGCTGRTVAPGQSCAVQVRFTVHGAGPRPAVLRFDDNAPNGPHLASLQGNGITPMLAFNPAVVPAGRVTEVFGSGFTPGQPVVLTMPGFPETVTANPDPAGNFVAPLVIFPHATEGARAGEITIVGYQAPGNVVSADLLVVPGTVAPPDFVSRH